MFHDYSIELYSHSVSEIAEKCFILNYYRIAKKDIYVVHSLKGGLIGPLFAQINNKLATLFIIQGVFYQLPGVQTLLPHSCTLRGQHPYPGANQTCQSVLPHSHTLVIWPPLLGAGLWILICLHNSVFSIAYLPGLHAKYFNIPWRPLGHLRLTLRAGIALCIVAELNYTFHSSGCVRAQVTRSCHNYNGIIPLVS